MILWSKYTPLRLANPMGTLKKKILDGHLVNKDGTTKSLFFTYVYDTSEKLLLRVANPNKTANNYVTINYSDDIHDLLPTVTHVMKYEGTECRRGDFHFGPDYHLLCLRLMILGIQATF